MVFKRLLLRCTYPFFKDCFKKNIGRYKDSVGGLGDLLKAVKTTNEAFLKGKAVLKQFPIWFLFKAVKGPYGSHKIPFLGHVVEFIRTFFGNRKRWEMANVNRTDMKPLSFLKINGEIILLPS